MERTRTNSRLSDLELERELRQLSSSELAGPGLGKPLLSRRRRLTPARCSFPGVSEPQPCLVAVNRGAHPAGGVSVPDTKEEAICVGY